MKKDITIFLSYNPNSEAESTLAARLHTIGVVHGLTMFLPTDRDLAFISDETFERIKKSNYYIIFSNSLLTPEVKTEIEIAYRYIKDKKRILVIYDKTLCIESNKYATEFSNKKNSVELLKEITEIVPEKAVVAIISIGIGLMVLEKSTK